MKVISKVCSDTFSTEAFFINGVKGRLFAVYIAPLGQPCGSILHIPAFMEEMNRCRNLVTTQARELAAQGFACLILDLYGTGDSQGELSVAEWHLWKQDIEIVAKWLERKSNIKVILWGMRLGALLAADVANACPKRFQRLLLWQPVPNGRAYLTQILRLRMAYLVSHDLPQETTGDMRNQLVAGKFVEIAGYVLSREMSTAIDDVVMKDFKGLANCMIDWFENVSDVESQLSVGGQKVVNELEAIGARVTIHTYMSPRVWQLSERNYAPNLLEKTTAALLELTYDH